MTPQNPDPISAATDMIPVADSLDAIERAPEGSIGLDGKQNALQVIHQLLRGRYWWVLGLSVILGSLGAYIGYKRGGLIYTSTGAIRVNYALQRVLYSDDAEEGGMPGYDAFVESQKATLVSRRVIEEAIKDPNWLRYRPATSTSTNGDGDIVDLMGRLQVTEKNDLVQVQSSDPSPAVATAAVNAVIAAYKNLYIEKDLEDGDPRLQLLDDLQTQYNQQAAGIRDQIMAIANQYGSEQVDSFYAAKLAQYNKCEGAIEDLEQTLAEPALEPGQAPLSDMSSQALSFVDQRLGILYDKLSEAKLNLKILQRDFGPKWPQVIAAQETVDAIQQEINDRVKEVNDAAGTGIRLAGLPAGMAKNTPRDLATIKAQLAILEPHRDQLRRELTAIGRDNLQLSELRTQAEEIKTKADDVHRRTEELRVEKPTARRIEIVSEGDWPLMPDKDTRPRLAAAFGVSGTMLATLAVMAVGLLSGRLRAPQDLQMRVGNRPVLGVIPTLSEGPNFAMRAAIAAECVHKTRTMLEIWGRGSKQLCIGVTSPSHGAGNTSVALSLGVSFATAGMRTLLIDCDFVTRGLTSRFGTVVRRDLTTVLQRTGLLTESQLHYAMRMAQQQPAKGFNRRTVGEICVDLGYLTAAELEAAVALQASDCVGVLDALGDEPLAACVGQTGIRNLSLLPLGGATAVHAAKVSSNTLRRTLDIARTQYDTIIIDTCSILTGLEASIVASAVDGMVVTVSRGEQHARVHEALRRLKNLSCPVAGIIFNQALASDTPFTTVDRMPDAHGPIMYDETAEGAINEPAGRLATLGPLARVVISHVSSTHEGN